MHGLWSHHSAADTAVVNREPRLCYTQLPEPTQSWALAVVLFKYKMLGRKSLRLLLGCEAGQEQWTQSGVSCPDSGAGGAQQSFTAASVCPRVDTWAACRSHQDMQGLMSEHPLLFLLLLGAPPAPDKRCLVQLFEGALTVWVLGRWHWVLVAVLCPSCKFGFCSVATKTSKQSPCNKTKGNANLT